MPSQASARQAIVAPELKRTDGSDGDPRKGLMPELRMWKEIAVAELLNLLERGRYDLESTR